MSVSNNFYAALILKVKQNQHVGTQHKTTILGIITLSVTALSITKLSIMTLCITALSMTILSIVTLNKRNPSVLSLGIMALKDT